MHHHNKAYQKFNLHLCSEFLEFYYNFYIKKRVAVFPRWGENARNPPGERLFLKNNVHFEKTPLLSFNLPFAKYSETSILYK